MGTRCDVIEATLALLVRMGLRGGPGAGTSIQIARKQWLGTEDLLPVSVAQYPLAEQQIYSTQYFCRAYFPAFGSLV